MWYLILSLLTNPNEPTLAVIPINPITVQTQSSDDGDGSNMGDRGNVRPPKP